MSRLLLSRRPRFVPAAARGLEVSRFRALTRLDYCFWFRENRLFVISETRKSVNFCWPTKFLRRSKAAPRPFGLINQPRPREKSVWQPFLIFRPTRRPPFTEFSSPRILSETPAGKAVTPESGFSEIHRKTFHQYFIPSPSFALAGANLFITILNRAPQPSKQPFWSCFRWNQ